MKMYNRIPSTIRSVEHTGTQNTTFPLSPYPALLYQNSNHGKPRQKFMPSGLLGYYFRDNDFTNLVLIQNGQELHSPWQAFPSYTAVLARKLQNFGSIRWIGRIFAPQTGTYQFSSSANTDVKMSIVVTSSYGPNRNLFYKEYVAIDDVSTPYFIQLQQGHFYEIMIEYRPTTLQQSLQLYWSYNNQTLKQIPNKYLFPPSVSAKDRKQNQLIPRHSLFKLLTNDVRLREDRQFVDRNLGSLFGKDTDRNLGSLFDKDTDRNLGSLFDKDTDRNLRSLLDIDTDDDGIPDTWEKEGYTAIATDVACQLVKWEDKYAELGYTKYISNPGAECTAHDAYSDLFKVTILQMNPLLAAYPVIGVSLEKIIVASTETVSSHEDHTLHSEHSYTNTENIKIDTGYSGERGFSFGVSADYSHSDTNSAGKSDTTGSSLQINASAAATVNFNLRYYNAGNIDLYNVKPTMNFVIGTGKDKETFATVKPQRELGQEADVVSVDEYYPALYAAPINLVSADQFNSGAVHLNLNQFQRFLKGEPIWVSTSQVEGNIPEVYHTVDKDQPYVYIDPVIQGGSGEAGSFSQFRASIEKHTASIILNVGGVNILPRERRVAAKNPRDLQDHTPVLTLKDALLTIDNVSFKNERLIYTMYNKGLAMELPLDESAVQIITDEYTQNRINQQLPKIQSVYDVVIEPEMNFTIRFPDIYDDANKGLNNEVFSWENTKDFVQDSVEPNGYSYLADQAAFGELKLQAGQQPLEANSQYLLSTYVKLPNETALITKEEIVVNGDSNLSVFQKLFHNKHVDVGDILEIMHVEPGRLWLYFPNGEFISLGALLQMQSSAPKTVRFTITTQGFQLQDQIFTRIGIGGLNLNDPKGNLLYGDIRLDTKEKKLLVEKIDYGAIHVYFPGIPYFSAKILKVPTIRLGVGNGKSIDKYITSESFLISAPEKWLRIQFIFEIGNDPAKMNTVLILPDQQQLFQFDAISLTKLSNVKQIQLGNIVEQHVPYSWFNLVLESSMIQGVKYRVPPQIPSVKYQLKLDGNWSSEYSDSQVSSTDQNGVRTIDFTKMVASHILYGYSNVMLYVIDSANNKFELPLPNFPINYIVCRHLVYSWDVTNTGYLNGVYVDIPTNLNVLYKFKINGIDTTIIKPQLVKNYGNWSRFYVNMLEANLGHGVNIKTNNVELYVIDATTPSATGKIMEYPSVGYTPNCQGPA
ncbi:binary toxin-like calcium binding domain-containing protein [Bacillus cereus]|uniref:binary toxin-like calcium binding domain-containing protein n=1 Tax=Bacillus cereus TaxID=1396 RepID=UPI0040438084